MALPIAIGMAAFAVGFAVTCVEEVHNNEMQRIGKKDSESPGKQVII